MNSKHLFVTAALLCALAMGSAWTQTAQVGGDNTARSTSKLRMEYVHYRPAEWENERVTEAENQFPNEGGLVYLYFRNATDKRVDLRYWNVNRHDESYWLLNHFVRWSRAYQGGLAPGELGVLEINAVTKDFAPGKEFNFAYMDSTWRPAMRFEAVLDEDPVQVSFIRVLPGMRELEVHLRNEGKGRVKVNAVTVEKHTVAEADWVGAPLPGPGHAIARVTLEKALKPEELVVLGLDIEDEAGKRRVYAHRRAFEDAFPIGVWSNNERTWGLLRRMHIDTVVRGGSKDDPFYSKEAARYGLHTMVHTGQIPNVDTLRDLADHPAVRCWMIRDEPDWSIPANIMLHADKMTRHYNNTKPTFITLCRNIKFFEYAPIADIPCMDHYSVTAPSSSKWPKLYGTYLEETAWYTRDLKLASEPKPIWIWTQGIAGWNERPRRPVPTPEELAAQLVFNLGRGAKGILWFNYDEKVAEEYPDAREAMQRWGRVMTVLREDFLGSEPVQATRKAPQKVDVAVLASRDKLMVCLVNTDYEIHPEAYPFQTKRNVEVEVALPNWINAEEAFVVAPDGVAPVAVGVKNGTARFTLDELPVCAVVVLAQSGARATCETAFEAALAGESREF